jgi:hypothetical protein
MPLSPLDRHYINTLKIPITNGHKEFDAEIGSLHKLLVETINVREFKKVDAGIDKRSGQIKTLGTFLEHTTGKSRNPEFEILVDVYSLRTGIGHVKNLDYEEKLHQLGYEPGNTVELFRNILQRVNEMLSWMQGVTLDS